VNSDETATNLVETTTRPPDDGGVRDELRSRIAYLRRTLDPEIEAGRCANHLLAQMIDERRDRMRQLEAGVNH
jgi:hypothetical protein